jgi:hypothetical protein
MNNMRRTAEALTVIAVFHELTRQCKIGNPVNADRLQPILDGYDAAMEEALVGYDDKARRQLKNRARREMLAIIDPWSSANAAVSKVYLMAHVWLLERIEKGLFVVADGPFKTAYDAFAAMVEDSDEDMRNLSHPGLQRSALRGVEKLDQAFRSRFG